MVKNQILKSGREVNLRTSDLREFIEDFIRKCRCSVLNRTAQPVRIPGAVGQDSQSLDIKVHVRDTPVG